MTGIRFCEKGNARC